nr:hypothetical protein [Secundilactobacillus kimchicus]
MKGLKFPNNVPTLDKENPPQGVAVPFSATLTNPDGSKINTFLYLGLDDDGKITGLITEDEAIAKSGQPIPYAYYHYEIVNGKINPYVYHGAEIPTTYKYETPSGVTVADDGVISATTPGKYVITAKADGGPIYEEDKLYIEVNDSKGIVQTNTNWKPYGKIESAALSLSNGKLVVSTKPDDIAPLYTEIGTVSNEKPATSILNVLHDGTLVAHEPALVTIRAIVHSIGDGSALGSDTMPTLNVIIDKELNVTVDVKPTDANTIEEIQTWLTAHSIDFTGKSAKADLLALVPKD